MCKPELFCFCALLGLPLLAEAQATTPATSVPCEPQAFGGTPIALFQPFASLPDAAYSQFDESGATNTSVQVLVTVGPDGRVKAAEALSGLDFLREPATNLVRHYRYQPILRYGQPVCALVSANINFQTPGKPLVPQDFAAEGRARQRLKEIEKQWARTPEQVFADLQQERDVPGGYRRTLALPNLAKAALAAGALDKAVAYAKEGIGSNGGANSQCVFDCNIVLGEVALRNGNIPEASQYLLAAGKNSGTPALMSFGPGMSLAKELLEKGQRDTVLEFFTLCKGFWTDRGKVLDQWSDTVRTGGIPNFGANLLY